MAPREVRKPAPDQAFAVICPLCGALPGEPCLFFLHPKTYQNTAHAARKGEARRQQILKAEPTADVGRWATLAERAGR